MAAEFTRNGGEVVRVKNAMTKTADEIEEVYGYRAVLTNYRVVCEGVTYADVIPHLHDIVSELIWGIWAISSTRLRRTS